MLHGSGPGVNGWSNFMSSFSASAKSFRTIMPGFGRIPLLPLEDRYPEVVAGTILHLMDELDVRVAHLVGNPMGSRHATRPRSHDPTRKRPAPVPADAQRRAARLCRVRALGTDRKTTSNASHSNSCSAPEGTAHHVPKLSGNAALYTEKRTRECLPSASARIVSACTPRMSRAAHAFTVQSVIGSRF